jgi:hypothetical protein
MAHEKFPGAVTYRMPEKIAAFGGADKRSF